MTRGDRQLGAPEVRTSSGYAFGATGEGTGDDPSIPVATGRGVALRIAALYATGAAKVNLRDGGLTGTLMGVLMTAAAGPAIVKFSPDDLPFEVNLYVEFETGAGTVCLWPKR